MWPKTHLADPEDVEQASRERRERHVSTEWVQRRPRTAVGARGWGGSHWVIVQVARDWASAGWVTLATWKRPATETRGTVNHLDGLVGTQASVRGALGPD